MYTVGNFTSDFSNIIRKKKCFLKLILWGFFLIEEKKSLEFYKK